jgi:hypothetical protein
MEYNEMNETYGSERRGRSLRSPLDLRPVPSFASTRPGTTAPRPAHLLRSLAEPQLVRAMYEPQRTLSQQTDEEGSLAMNDDEAPLLRGTRIKVSHIETGTASMMSCIANL